jgi:hypothetical protein
VPIGGFHDNDLGDRDRVEAVPVMTITFIETDNLDTGNGAEAGTEINPGVTVAVGTRLIMTRVDRLI